MLLGLLAQAALLCTKRERTYSLMKAKRDEIEMKPIIKEEEVGGEREESQESSV